LFWFQDSILGIRTDLDRYAKFLGLRLYPKSLIEDLQEFLASHHEFFKRYQEIEKLAMKLMEIKSQYLSDRDLLQYHLGLNDYHSSSYSSEVETRYKGTAQTIIKENSQLVSETKDYLQKTRESASKIFSELEDFLKSNNLRLEPEPTTSWF
jgi:hypothetical protein